ncbi:MAG TPA: ABC transporter permease [Candidatus Polarisedimenticolia bacterium]|jgi:putative ABC transport system permease protein|nr:ABC transporter permease [Candidatus Polarisedimenticolia bacterium]
MPFSEGLLIALKALWANKLRSFLTVLGNIIAITSIVAVVSVIQGMNSYVEEKVAGLGANLFVLRKGPFIITSHEAADQIRKRRRITLEDQEEVRRSVVSARFIGAHVSSPHKVRFRERYIDEVEIQGQGLPVLIPADFEVERGRLFSTTEVERARNVAVLGFEVADKLFAGADPVGKEVKIDETSYTILGVAKEQGAVLGVSQDKIVAIPISAYQKQFGNLDSVDVPVEGADEAAVAALKDEIRMVMRVRHHLKPGQEDDFALESSESLTSFWKQISAAIFGAASGLVSLSLVVGGIVIMNIMLVSVTERTKEIGIRKALGAKRRHILWQFLIESIALSTLGGILGVLAGYGLCLLIRALTPLPTSMSPYSIVLALGIVFVVGLVFGIYPANRAARLDPIEALRYE